MEIVLAPLLLGCNQNVPFDEPIGIVIVVMLLPPEVAWNVSEPLVLWSDTTTALSSAGSLSVTVNSTGTVYRPEDAALLSVVDAND
jgi:hypothetical protein